MTGSHGAETTADNTFSGINTFFKAAPSATDGYNVAAYVFRDTTGLLGGTAGNVNPTFRSYTKTGSGVAAYEWGILSVLDNYATAGEDVAIYGQGNKGTGVGPTWAAVVEARDRSNNPNPTTALVGIEVDVFANGADANSSRIGIDVVAGIGVPGGVPPAIYAGIRIGPQNEDAANATISNGLLLKGAMTNAINLFSSGETGITFGNSLVTGMDLSRGSYAGEAVLLNANQAIRFDTTANLSLSYHSSAAVFLFSGAPVQMQNSMAFPSVGNVASTASAGTAILPAAPAGFLIFKLDGVNYKLPYYGN